MGTPARWRKDRSAAAGGKTFTAIPTPHGDNHVVWINPDNPKILIETNDGGANVTQDGGRSWSTQMNQPTAEFYNDQMKEWAALKADGGGPSRKLVNW